MLSDFKILFSSFDGEIKALFFYLSVRWILLRFLLLKRFVQNG